MIVAPTLNQPVQIWYSSIKRMVTGPQQSRGQDLAQPGVNIHGQTGKGSEPCRPCLARRSAQAGAKTPRQLRQEAASGCCDPITIVPCGNIRRVQ